MTLSRYEKIAQGLNSHYTEKAKKRMAEKAELNFNRSTEAFDKAMKSNDADIAEYKELTAKLEKLQIHVEELHSEGVI